MVLQQARNYSGTTRYEFVSGKCKWAKVFRPDTMPNGGQKWKVDIYPDDKGVELINKLKAEGLLNILRKDEDGYNMTFSRPTQKIMRGSVVAFPPPIVWDKDLNPVIDIGIGNGSDVTLKLEIYKYSKPGGGKGIAARLVALRIDNLVPYERTKDSTPIETLQTKGLENVPAPIF